MTIAVAGATGTTGSAVVDALVAAGVPVRALSRGKDKLAALTRPGVEAVAVTYDEPGSVRAALDGASAAYLAMPTEPDMAATEGAFARAAAEAGVPVVKLSVIGAAIDGPMRFSRAHAESEQAIEAAGGVWTFLRPNRFMQNDLAWAAQVPSGSVAGPVMDAAWSIIDARDIGAVAAAVLTDPAAFAGRRLTLTGPEPRTPRSRVEALGDVLGRPLTAVDVPIPAAVDQLRGYGVPEWTAAGLGELYELYVTGVATVVAPDVEQVLGRPGRTWEEFAADHAAAFSG